MENNYSVITPKQTLKAPASKKFVLYPNASWYFGLAIAVTVTGFSRSYFGRLGDVTIYHHIHGATAGLWMVVLIIQPLLYKKGKYALHRKIGWVASFSLVPLLMLGGLKMIADMLLSASSYPPGIPYRLSFIDVYSLLFFLLCFTLAIVNSRNIHLHARYMACTVLIVLPPAIVRLLFLLPWFHTFNQTLNASFAILETVLLLLIADDRRAGKIRKPYLLALAFFALLHLLMNYAGDWSWWKSLMDKYASLNF